MKMKPGYFGRIGRIDTSALPSGTTKCEFSIAQNGYEKTQEVTEWLNCVAWGKTADNVSTYFKKGDRIFVRGDWDISHWTNKEGKTQTRHSFAVEGFEFVESKSDANSTAVPAQTSNGYAAKKEGFDQDIGFGSV